MVADWREAYHDAMQELRVAHKKLAEQDARIKALKEERDAMLNRHLRYSEGIRHAIGDDNRQKRHTGEPAQSDRREIVAMLAHIKELEEEREVLLGLLDRAQVELPTDELREDILLALAGKEKSDAD